MSIKQGLRLVSSDGSVISLGRELGRGGEGAVFEVEDCPSVVAKLYTQAIGPDKAEKLKVMASLSDAELMKVAAWPLATVGLQQNDVRGFLMPKLTDYRPLFDLYNPVSRRQKFPRADYHYLLHCARNLAAAFHIVHARGCTVGDVNQGNAWVHQSKGMVSLIDCDSFQLQHNGRLWLCEVGVPHFTPPELQDLQNFRDRPRTLEHDHFGLAVLLFHLLFFGRHPYSGVYQGKKDVPLEQAIRNHWFAYSRQVHTQVVRPPPGAVPLALLGPEIAGAFEAAFAGTLQRPKAEDWYRLLGGLESALARCADDSSHVYPNHMPECPWCEVEERTGVVLFLGQAAPIDAFAGRFNPDIVWRTIEAILSPGPAPTINPLTISAEPKVGTNAQMPKWLRAAARFVIVAVATAVVINDPDWLFGMLILGYIGWIAAEGVFQADTKPYDEALASKKLYWERVLADWNTRASEGRFASAKAELVRLRDRYTGLPEAYQRELQRLKQKVRENQMRRFLERFLVKDARIRNIGDSRKAVLQSFGINCAADVTRSAIANLDGFGPVLQDSLLQWRHRCETHFTFDPSKGVDPQDIITLNRHFEHQRRDLESRLQQGGQQLANIALEINKARQSLFPLLETAAREYAQALANRKAL
jgi:DNA-binding helix-hairpin-helix protein with protein kinase domain